MLTPPMRDKNEGTYRGGRGGGAKTPVTTPWLVQKVAEGKTSFELRWRANDY